MKVKFEITLIFLLFGLLISNHLISQEISKPEFYINNNEITSTAICANQNVPNRSVIAKYTGPAGYFGIGTVFVLELSDENGVFQDTPLELSRLTLSFAISSTKDLDFGPFTIPQDLRGENYSLRVRDTDSLIVSITENIPIYFFDMSKGVTLTGPNIDANNVALCPGEFVTLTALPEGFDNYIWTFNGSVISGENSNTLQNVLQPGNYGVKVDFGFCNDFFSFDSANVNVILFDTNNVFIEEGHIMAPLEFCPQDTKLLSCSIDDTAYTYEWFLDDILIENSNTPILTLPQSNFGGNYTVRVIDGVNCSVTTNPLRVVNLGSDILTQPPSRLALLPNETLTLGITTNAPDGSTIQWYENNMPISGANGLSLAVDRPNTYRVDISANDICSSPLQAEIEVFAAIDFKPVIGQEIDCVDRDGTVLLKDIFGITEDGLEIPLINEQYNFFEFEWIKDGVSTEETGIIYNVDGIGDNGEYTLATYFKPGDFSSKISNDVTILFLPNESIISSSHEFLPVDGNSTLSVPENKLYTYEWFIEVEGVFESIDLETSNTLEVFEEGKYKVIMTYLECVVEEEILIKKDLITSTVIPNVITPYGSPGVNDDWILPNEYREPDVEVKIYSLNGKLDFETLGGYTNNWPSESASNASEFIYYYIITKDKSIVKKGTITVLK